MYIYIYIYIHTYRLTYIYVIVKFPDLSVFNNNNSVMVSVVTFCRTVLFVLRRVAGWKHNVTYNRITIIDSASIAHI